jgi:hypothetical protein
MKCNTRTAIWVVITLVASSLLGTAGIVAAREQTQSLPAIAPSQSEPAAPPVWTADQLDNLVAPIALYPDPLLSQMLVASTYPLEIVQANQWLQRNKNLQGQALTDAARQQPWDPSIQTLVTVPEALNRLNEDIQWTTDLGNAFLSQESDVMNAVQRMRARADDNGRLATTQQQKVIIQNQDNQRVVVIEPAYPDVIYVPVYDPFYVWGPPVYGYYPALYYPRHHFGFSIGFNIGFCFSDWGGWGFWGWGPSWHSHSVIVNNYFFNRYGYNHYRRGNDRGRIAWEHNPVHRLNVPYRNPRVAERFGGPSSGSRDSRRGITARYGAGAHPGDRPENRFSGRSADQGLRNTSFQGQRYQSPARQGHPSSQPNESRMAPQGQRYQVREQDSSKAPQPARSEPRRYSEGPRVVPFGNSRESQNQESRQYRNTPQRSREPEVQQNQGMPQQIYRAPQQNRPVPQVFHAPEAQQSKSMPQQRYEPAPQYRSAPQMSTPPQSGGGRNNSRGGDGGSSRGGDSGHNHRGDRGR